MYSRKLSKSFGSRFREPFSELVLGLSPENYSVLLVPVPSFLRKRTPSLAAFPKLVKYFPATSFKKGSGPFFQRVS